MAKKIQAQKMSREAESQFIAQNLPGFMGARQSAYDWMNPANDAAALERYRQAVMSQAGQAGLQGANMAAWQGLGSGAQQASMNSALMQGLGAAGGFARMQLTPEYKMNQFMGLRGIMDPFQNRTEKELSLLGKQGQATKAQYSGQGGLGGFLSQVGSLASQFMPMTTPGTGGGQSFNPYGTSMKSATMYNPAQHTFGSGGMYSTRPQGLI